MIPKFDCNHTDTPPREADASLGGVEISRSLLVVRAWCHRGYAGLPAYP